jgi:hypothetical protein
MHLLYNLLLLLLLEKNLEKISEIFCYIYKDLLTLLENLFIQYLSYVLYLLLEKKIKKKISERFIISIGIIKKKCFSISVLYKKIVLKHFLYYY